MLVYKDFKWQQPDYVIDGLHTPRSCPHCGGSAIIEFEGFMTYVKCQKEHWNKDKTENCGYNHYCTSETNRTIDLWNKYNGYMQVGYDELSDVHYYVEHGNYPEN